VDAAHRGRARPVLPVRLPRAGPDLPGTALDARLRRQWENGSRQPNSIALPFGSAVRASGRMLPTTQPAWPTCTPNAAPSCSGGSAVVSGEWTGAAGGERSRRGHRAERQRHCVPNPNPHAESVPVSGVQAAVMRACSADQAAVDSDSDLADRSLLSRMPVRSERRSSSTHSFCDPPE
jgi:hypothetical protein